MQDQPSRERMSPQEEDNEVADIVLRLMLDDDAPGLWSVDEIAIALGDKIKATDTIVHLHAAGLIHGLDQYLWPTRPAARATELAGVV
jgi:hypothetical protein